MPASRSDLPIGCLIATALLATALACGGDNLILPGASEPAALDVVGGNNQSAQVGASLPEAVVVRVTDGTGRPVVGARVSFRVTSASGGALSPGEAATNDDGQASTEWSLGATAGAQTAEARVESPSVAPVGLTAFAAAGIATRLRLVTGDHQTAPVGTTLAESLVVRATDASGNPVEGVGVAWTAPDGGSVSASAVPTDASGRAGVLRTLGPTAGPQTTLATAAGVPGVTFTATATSGSVGKLTIVVQPSAAVTNGRTFAEQPRVQLVDAFNNPVTTAGVAVTVTVSGNPDGVELRGQRTVSTDAGGSAQFTGLSLVGPAGTYALRFSGASLADVVSRPIALEPGPVSADRSSVTASPRSIVVMAETATMTVVLRDDFGFPIEGVVVTPSANRDGGTFAPGSAASDAAGRATFAFSATVPDEFRLSARAGSVELDDRPRVTVTKAATTSSVTSDLPDPSTLFEPVTVTFVVTSTIGASLNGTVTVHETDGNGSCTVPVAAGRCDVRFSALGKRSVLATYEGDALHQPSSSSPEPHDVQLFAQ